MELDWKQNVLKSEEFDMHFPGTLGYPAYMRIRIGDRSFVRSDVYWHDEFDSAKQSLEALLTADEGFIDDVIPPYGIDYADFYPIYPELYDREKDYFRVTVCSQEGRDNLEGVCEKRQFVGALYQGLMEILLKDEDEVDGLIRDCDWIRSHRIPLYGRIKSRRVEQYAFGASKELVTKPLGWIQVKSGRKGLYQDHFGTYSNDLPSLLDNPSLIDTPAAAPVLRELDEWWSRNIVCTGQDWDNYVSEGEGICKRLRTHLAPSIDLWFFNRFIPVV